MKSISISRAKTWKTCKLQYKYTYETKFVPTEEKPIYVTAKGLALHETFEAILKYENYKDDVACLPYRQMSIDDATKILNEEILKQKLPPAEVENFNMDLGLMRWLSFKHDFLDKNGHTMYAEKRYEQVLFGETTTITILDLLEDCGDGNYIIYDYKTPKSIDVSRYKEQLVLYAYVMACIKGIIKPGSTNYEDVAKHFKLFVFFPLAEGGHVDYKGSLKPLKFTANDVQSVIEHLQQTCNEIDAFDFNKPAEVLQPVQLNYQCNWCTFCGSAPQPEIGFQGCPLSKFCGKPATNESFKKVEK